jgi:enamine deaminase RidA (YjgF/YER057c/UK114 family)
VLERPESRRLSPATTFIGQAPLEGDGSCLQIAARAVLRAKASRCRARPFIAQPRAAARPCSAGLHGRVIRVGDRTHLHAGNVFGRGKDAAAEVFDMFCEAERLLQAAGMEFTDVIRTWVYLRDIDRDYTALNLARREFFASRGIERRPASTGVQGIPFAAAHNFSLSLFAVKSHQPLDVARMSTPTLNEAWTYGADFSRGLRLDDGNTTSLIVSGTASVDQNGLSVHADDLAGRSRACCSTSRCCSMSRAPASAISFRASRTSRTLPMRRLCAASTRSVDLERSRWPWSRRGCVAPSCCARPRP